MFLLLQHILNWRRTFRNDRVHQPQEGVAILICDGITHNIYILGSLCRNERSASRHSKYYFKPLLSTADCIFHQATHYAWSEIQRSSDVYI